MMKRDPVIATSKNKALCFVREFPGGKSSSILFVTTIGNKKKALEYIEKAKAEQAL